jgi:hypothetical protein
MIKLSLQEVMGQAFLINKEPAKALALWTELLHAFESTVSSVIEHSNARNPSSCSETLAAAAVHLEEIQLSTLAQRAPDIIDEKGELLRQIERASLTLIAQLNGGVSLGIDEVLREKHTAISPHILIPILGILARGIDQQEECLKQQRLLVHRWEIAAPYLVGSDESLYQCAGLAGLELLEFLIDQRKGGLASEIALYLLPHLVRVGPHIGNRIESCAYGMLSTLDFDDAKDVDRALQDSEITFACVNGRLANLVQSADLYCSEREFEEATLRITKAREFIDEKGEKYFERECLAYFFKTSWLIASENGNDLSSERELETIEHLLRQMMKYTKFEGQEFLHRGIIRAEAASRLAEIELKRGEVDSAKKFLSEAWVSLQKDLLHEPALNFLIASDCIGLLSDLPSYTPKDAWQRDRKMFKIIAYAMSPQIVRSGHLKLGDIVNLARHALSVGHSLQSESRCSIKQRQFLNAAIAKISQTVVKLVRSHRNHSVRYLRVAKEFQEARVSCLESRGIVSTEALTNARKVLASIERVLQRRDGWK